MAEQSTDNKVIRKKDDTFPEWLNFDQLRSEGIDHIGRLSGNIWTDHNVHDPGITILEMLCYALLDLGYRTTLPDNDLFANDPAKTDGTADFFSPSSILANNPLTILDYRRLLIDIPGIRNAWIEVNDWLIDTNIIATDDYSVSKQVDPGRLPCNNMLATAKNADGSSSYGFLNGLYHVYVDLEKNVETDFNTPQGTEELKRIKKDVSRALQSHRNLCEDFIDLMILCKQEIAVSANIELEPNANPEKVYLQIMRDLRNFFSPAPRFYTLQALLDKGKNIEDIYAGRPYDVKQSHGFVDTDEFENIVLKKEIHLSDVYHVIFDVPGVSAVCDIRIMNVALSPCSDKNGYKDWLFRLHKNHVAEFKAGNSQLKFVQNGVNVTVAKPSLPLSLPGRALYNSPSPYLDAAIPKGIYRADLDEYYSIQNEFPGVYKIGAGQLLDSMPDIRKSQAYQLKGYLLFFDQLLADYLSQLKNARALLSLSQPIDIKDDRTYFANTLNTVSDIDKLTRFNSSGQLLKQGKLLAFPVAREKLEQLIKKQKITEDDIRKASVPYMFTSGAASSIAISQLAEDLSEGNYTPQLIKTFNGCYFFYFITSSDKIALFGSGHYTSEKQARRDADLVLVSSGFQQNYRSYINAADQLHSFELDLDVYDHSKILQMISEDENRYAKRKQQFLDHLLARFAERFTDYAMLSYGLADNDKLVQQDIIAKQNFLGAYPELSSNRGKAYDYKLDGWNTPNISGMEKRFGALAGIEKWERTNHCHFDVLPYERQVYVHISTTSGDKEYDILKGIDRFDESDGADAYLSLVKALGDRNNYDKRKSVYAGKEEIFVRDGLHRYEHPWQFDSSEIDAEIDKLHRLFSQQPLPEHSSMYDQQLSVRNAEGKEVLIRKDVIKYPSKEMPVKEGIIKEINEKKKWNHTGLPSLDPDYRMINSPEKPSTLINVNAFAIEGQKNDLKGKQYTYEFVVDPKEEKLFLFHSVNDFENKELAEEQGRLFLFELLNEKSYDCIKKAERQYCITVAKDGKVQAVDSIEYENGAAAYEGAKRIMEYVNRQVYDLVMVATESAWKFNYPLSYPGKKEFIFTSKKDYPVKGAATKEAKSLVSAVKGYAITKSQKNELEIKDADNTVIAFCSVAGEKNEIATDLLLAQQLFELKNQVNSFIQQPAKYQEKYIVSGEVSTKEAWIYRLYRKNHYEARYLKGAESDKEQQKKLIKEIFKKYPDEYTILELCYGGDIIRERKHGKCNATFYHYEIKCRNRFYTKQPVQLKELVLFESVQGYESVDEAKKAFEENYMSILSLGIKEASYGTDINFKEIFTEGTGNTDDTPAIVFIPKETMEEYGNHDDNVKRNLVVHARSFPVRAIKKSSPEFTSLFSCKISKTETPVLPVKCGEAKPEKDVFYFILSEKPDAGIPGSIEDAWASENYYDTMAEALEAFNFFILLLRYKGNYHISRDCDCRWQLYIHEILAVSERKFATEQLAWGVEGVEKFISVAQADHSFHAYFDKDFCRYTFYTTCADSGLVHPCTYETPEKRDQKLQQLYDAAKNDSFLNPDWKWESLSKELQDILHKLTREKGPLSPDQVLDIFDTIRNGDLDAELSKLADEERKKLAVFATQYPLSRHICGGDKTPCYNIWLRLAEDTNGKEDDCGNETASAICGCTIAWETHFCYKTADEAELELKRLPSILKDSSIYRGSFDCPCGEYGIRVVWPCEEFSPKRKAAKKDIPVYCNEAIAFNPQYYPMPRMACEAIDRARKLINDEGIHLIEHILLRPLNDKECDDLVPSCPGTQCDFDWPVNEEDHCKEDNSRSNIRFLPGEDPYSFIATVVLPAWPLRFRKKENRELLENILQREVPAHIMIRVLWLRPADLCEFELLFKHWIIEKSGRDTCSEKYSKKEFIGFLFRKQFNCLPDTFPCDSCEPVKQEEHHSESNWLSLVNRLYCWSDIRCSSSQAESKFVNDRFKTYKINLETYTKGVKNTALTERAGTFLKAPKHTPEQYRQLVAALLDAKEKGIITIQQTNDIAVAVTAYYLDNISFRTKDWTMLDHSTDTFKTMDEKGIDMQRIFKEWNQQDVQLQQPDADVYKVYRMLTAHKK
ncbi:MAG: hypothetical protein KF746_21045 [Chitinophagaceae bacterium]|nr:hypothetical protein [Chitinophagaceae bacterium]